MHLDFASKEPNLGPVQSLNTVDPAKDFPRHLISSLMKHLISLVMKHMISLVMECLMNPAMGSPIVLVML